MSGMTLESGSPPNAKRVRNITCDHGADINISKRERGDDVPTKGDVPEAYSSQRVWLQVKSSLIHQSIECTSSRDSHNTTKTFGYKYECIKHSQRYNPLTRNTHILSHSRYLHLHLGLIAETITNFVLTLII